jgi:nitrate reductase cytochrome c-type subunit
MLVLVAPLLAGCGDRRAKEADARILAEFRGPHSIPAAQRRTMPGGPPLVPHVVYSGEFQCLVCHEHKEFRFRGQLVPTCTHPERRSCLQCHVPLQTGEEPFRFEKLGQGTITQAANP